MKISKKGLNCSIQSEETLPDDFYGDRPIKRSYDALGWSDGMEIENTTYDISYGYDDVGRFNTLTMGAHEVSGQFLPDSNLLAEINRSNDVDIIFTYEPDRDLVDYDYVETI